MHEAAMTRFLVFPILLFLPTFTWSQEERNGGVIHTIYLVGDCGEPYLADMPLGGVLRQQVKQSGENTTVLFLGDNIYPKGMPDHGEKTRATSEKILKTQTNWIKGLEARGIFVPGNHDWQKGKKKGVQYVQYQQLWLDSLGESNITLLPRDACPGPVEIPLSDFAVLVIIDTQWFLHPWNKPGEESDCDAKNQGEALLLLRDVFARNSNKRIILAAHHPLLTYGEHGGVFQLKDHIFPLTALNTGLYFPIPILGSIYPLYRKWFGDIQDLAHPKYKEMSGLIQSVMDENPGSIYVSGHEHALQYLVKDSSHFIVSGSGSKTSFVKQKKYSRFAAAVTGFVKLSLHEDGSVGLAFWQADEKNPEGKEVYTEHLQPVKLLKTENNSEATDFSVKKIKAHASGQYDTGPVRKFLMGENYRSAWKQEIEAHVFDLGEVAGGLTILKQGGGMQTLSLQLKDSTGREYVLRSIEKFPEKAVPEMFRKTFAEDLVQDQISASHPYAAVPVSGLAEAAGIYHTNPEVVFIPDDPRLGIYRKVFSNTLAVFEERPTGDWSDKSFFGNSDNIINTSKVLERLKKDNDNQVDQHSVLRARLFDLWIGDWDRHDDQWRWASFKSAKGETYRPVPRDRDQAFFVNEGVLPKLWSRRWTLPKFEGFDDDIRWPSGLSYGARYFDRSFMTALSEDDWKKASIDLQARLTNDIIEQSIKRWPDEIYNLHGKAVVRKLESRKSKLETYALSHYRFLARAVDVLGSNQEERFEVRRFPEGDVQVKVFKSINSGLDDILYDRLFKKSETKEIRLYGLDGADKFEVFGSARSSITLRVIGGDGVDSLIDNSDVNGLKNKTLYYDSKYNNSIIQAGEVGIRTSSEPGVNVYDRMAFRYNKLSPLLSGNFNPDDGLLIGFGMLYQAEGFRASPYKHRHILSLSIAPRTDSYNLIYQGDFTNVVGKWGLNILADLKAPNYVNNFFGMGNESIFDQEVGNNNNDHAIDYYRYNFKEVKIETQFLRRINDWGVFKAGPVFQGVDIKDPDGGDRYITEYEATLPYDLFDEHSSYAGARWNFTIDKRNSERFTTRGVVLKIDGKNLAGVEGHADDFSSYEGSVSFYQTFRIPARVVFAFRTGAGINTGNYEFYQAQILNGITELRGFRKTRFYGDRKFYTNLEMRVKLLSLRTYLFPVSLGILGFHDLGRVWYRDGNNQDPTSASGKSTMWHKAWGGGLWFTPFNLTVLSVEAGHSGEGTLGYIRLGFLF